MPEPTTKPGLRDVIAGQTAICWLDEATQNFYYRGYAIQDLAEHCTFEEVAYLLIYGRLPNRNENSAFQISLLNKQGIPRINIPNIDNLQEMHPMDALAMMVRCDAMSDINYKRPSTLSSDQEIAERLLARMPIFCALIGRPSANPLPYKQADDFLCVLHGEPSRSEVEVDALDIANTLYAEHEFNASTFAVRVAASAHTDLYSAVVAGISVLKGDRHGGANEKAMKLMLDINDPSKVSEYLEKFFAKPGARLPGFGHAVYTRSDPRVAILRPWVKKLSEAKGDSRWYEIALALEEAMAKRAEEKGKGIPANADLWTAPLYYLLGIPIELYTPLFAAARVAGWCAHYLEVRYENKEPIMRPRAEYIGPAPTPYIQTRNRT